MLFNVFLAPLVSIPNDVLKETTGVLRNYFNQICWSMKPAVFSGATVRISPNAGDVGNRDLLAYITQASLILTLFDRVYEPGVTHSLPGTPGGGTRKCGTGIVSEVYWTGGRMELKTVHARGLALANLIFHEFAHNKHYSDALALSKGELPTGIYVHTECGDGVLLGGTNYGRMANISQLTAKNISSMARVLNEANEQNTCGLFNEKLGY